MTDHAPRLYALTITVLGFFLAWALVAAHPWAATAAGGTTTSPVVAQLAAYQQRLVRDAALVDRVARLRADRAAADRLASRRALAAQAVAAPAVAPTAPRIVYLPPLTVTRTS